MNAEAQYEMDVAAERKKVSGPFRKVWKICSYIGFAVVGYAGAIAVVVLLASMMNS